MELTVYCFLTGLTICVLGSVGCRQLALQIFHHTFQLSSLVVQLLNPQLKVPLSELRLVKFNAEVLCDAVGGRLSPFFQLTEKTVTQVWVWVNLLRLVGTWRTAPISFF